MTKPVQIQPVAWMYTWKEDVGNKFLGPVLKHVREPSGVLTGWDETPLVSAAAVRSLMEAKAKEWDNWADMHLDGEALTVANKCHFDLLALAATLGNQGK